MSEAANNDTRIKCMRCGAEHDIARFGVAPFQCGQCVNRNQKEFKMVPVNKAEAVDHPSHYTAHASGVECITIAEYMSFNLGNALKYIWRADLKGGVEDLEKARWYLDREIQRRAASES